MRSYTYVALILWNKHMLYTPMGTTSPLKKSEIEVEMTNTPLRFWDGMYVR